MGTGHNIIFEKENDLKAEFFAASLLEAGLLPEHITFRPLGPFKRRSHGDIEYTAEKEIGNFKGPVIDANRSGIYDYLPEQLFHLSSSKSGKSLKNKIEDIKAEREKELKTRLFFLPLEQEFFFSKVHASQIEQRATGPDSDSVLFGELRHFWQIPDFLPDPVFRMLLAILPQIADCKADLSKSETILSKILNVEVVITMEYGKNIILKDTAEIGAMRLGSDLLLGGILDSGLPELQINLCFINEAVFEKCFCNPDFDNMIHWLLGWLLPVEYDYKVNFSVSDAALYLLTESDSVILPRLGYTTTLTL